MKKFVSLISALVICLSLCVPAFAAEPAVEREIHDLGDGIFVIITVGEKSPVMPLTGIGGSANVGKTATSYNYNLVEQDGDYCTAHVWNDESTSSGNRIRVSCTITLRGEVHDFGSKDISPTDAPYYVQVFNSNGKGLSGRVNLRVSSLDSSSAKIRYDIDQIWKS